MTLAWRANTVLAHADGDASWDKRGLNSFAMSPSNLMVMTSTCHRCGDRGRNSCAQARGGEVPEGRSWDRHSAGRAVVVLDEAEPRRFVGFSQNFGAQRWSTRRTRTQGAGLEGRVDGVGVGTVEVVLNDGHKALLNEKGATVLIHAQRRSFIFL